jgi:hypothetical protein
MFVPAAIAEATLATQKVLTNNLDNTSVTLKGLKSEGTDHEGEMRGGSCHVVPQPLAFYDED